MSWMSRLKRRSQRIAAPRRAFRAAGPRPSSETSGHPYGSQAIRELVLQLTEQELRDRKRLADRVHNQLQQSLVAGKFRAVLLERDMPDSAFRKALDELVALLDQSLDQTRALTTELAPPVLHGGTLGECLQWVAQQVQKTHALQVSLTVATDAQCPTLVEQALVVSMAQELLDLGAESLCRRAHVTAKRDGGDLVIVIQISQSTLPIGESIQAFRHAASKGRLAELINRLKMLGGQVDVGSHTNKGVCVRLRLPMIER